MATLVPSYSLPTVPLKDTLVADTDTSAAVMVKAPLPNVMA